MARNSAVVAAQDAFFDRDWSRIRGSAPRQRQKQMARAAMGHSPAIFKGIRDGGTHSKAQLRNQLEYLTTKSSFILDSRGTYDGQSVLSAKEIEQVTRRFSAQWNEGLLRIAALENVDRQQMELQLLASLFLQAESDRVQGLLDGGIDLFVAAGLLAFERKRPTLGEIYRITASGGDKQKEYRRRADEVASPAAKLIFMRMATTNNDTLTSYLSLLMTSGLKQWSNPAIDRVTQSSDFDFRDIRKTPFSVYLVVEPLMVKPLAPLIRLFFSDLLASLQDHEPGKDEPWPVMIMLDERGGPSFSTTLQPS